MLTLKELLRYVSINYFDASADYRNLSFVNTKVLFNKIKDIYGFLILMIVVSRIFSTSVTLFKAIKPYAVLVDTTKDLIYYIIMLIAGKKHTGGHEMNNIRDGLIARVSAARINANGNLLTFSVLSENFYCELLNVLLDCSLHNTNSAA